MAKFLRDLLDAEEPIFSLSLKQLEKASGNRGVDAQLVGDITKKMHLSMRELGLDQKNTIGRELYQALLARVKEDNDRVTKIIGGKDQSDIRAMVPLMIKAAKAAKTNWSCWVLKHSVAKDLLRKMPPKNLIKHLGYSSVDAMLAKEDIEEIYVALRFSEGEDWLNEYNELFKTIKPSDFETRDISIIALNHDKYVDLANKFTKKKLHNVTHTKEMGIIVVLPMEQERMKGITLKTLPLLFHYINEIRLYSAFFKLKQVNKNFGETVVETLIADPGNASQMAGQNIHWRVIQRYFGRPTLSGERYPEAFQPHVQPEDLHWRRANDMLFDLDPDMNFWIDKDYVGLIFDDFPVTLNFVDISFSYSNEEPYEQSYFYHFRESLWNEIFMRYMGQKNLEDQVLRQLDNDMIAPQELKAPKMGNR